MALDGPMKGVYYNASMPLHKFREHAAELPDPERGPVLYCERTPGYVKLVYQWDSVKGFAPWIFKLETDENGRKRWVPKMRASKIEVGYFREYNLIDELAVICDRIMFPNVQMLDKLVHIAKHEGGKFIPSTFEYGTWPLAEWLADEGLIETGRVARGENHSGGWRWVRITDLGWRVWARCERAWAETEWDCRNWKTADEARTGR